MYFVFTLSVLVVVNCIDRVSAAFVDVLVMCYSNKAKNALDSTLLLRLGVEIGLFCEKCSQHYQTNSTENQRGTNDTPCVFVQFCATDPDLLLSG